MGSTYDDILLKSLSYCRETETYRAEYDRAEAPASMAVVAAVEDVLDADPMDLDQLYHSVDTDALDELMGRPEESAGTVQVSFSYQGCDVTVSSDGVLRLSPPADGATTGTDTPPAPSASTPSDEKPNHDGQLN